MSNWQPIFKTESLHKAEIIKAVLLDSEIEAVVINKKDSSYHFGDIEITVEKDNVIRALKIIGDINFA